MSRALEFSLNGTKKKPTQMYVHRQDFLLYLLYKDKCICLNAYFLDFGAPITHQVVRTN